MYYCSIFQQLFEFVPRYRFEKSVEKHSGDRYCKHFTAIRQLKTILYAQLAGKDSLREVESGLLMNANRMYHLDMEPVSSSTLSDAMNRRSPEIFRAMFEEILDRAFTAGEYYVSMTAKNTKANASGSVFYNVLANLTPSVADALAMPENSDSLAMTDALSFGQYDADALADASAFALADLDDKSGWQSPLA